MLTAPNIDPIAIHFPAFDFFGHHEPAIHWYGIMYLLGFLAFWWFANRRARSSGSTWQREEIADLLFYGALGVILGGRLGEVIFYQPKYFLEYPLKVFAIWEGGMSFHGGLLGVIVAIWCFARHTGRTFFQVADFVVPLTPIGLGAGRFGNFINQEYWGTVSDLPWAMVFRTGGPLARHPSQLYEVALEGVALFVILWLYSARPRATGAVSGLFLICYGAFRFAVEFVRVPDDNLGYLAFGWVTMGQMLCLPMLLFGAWLMWRAAHATE